MAYCRQCIATDQSIWHLKDLLLSCSNLWYVMCIYYLCTIQQYRCLMSLKLWSISMELQGTVASIISSFNKEHLVLSWRHDCSTRAAPFYSWKINALASRTFLSRRDYQSCQSFSTSLRPSTFEQQSLTQSQPEFQHAQLLLCPAQKFWIFTLSWEHALVLVMQSIISQGEMFQRRWKQPAHQRAITHVMWSCFLEQLQTIDACSMKSGGSHFV